MGSVGLMSVVDVAVQHVVPVRHSSASSAVRGYVTVKGLRSRRRRWKRLPRYHKTMCVSPWSWNNSMP